MGGVFVQVKVDVVLPGIVSLPCDPGNSLPVEVTFSKTIFPDLLKNQRKKGYSYVTVETIVSPYI